MDLLLFYSSETSTSAHRPQAWLRLFVNSRFYLGNIVSAWDTSSGMDTSVIWRRGQTGRRVSTSWRDPGRDSIWVLLWVFTHSTVVLGPVTGTGLSTHSNCVPHITSWDAENVAYVRRATNIFADNYSWPPLPLLISTLVDAFRLTRGVRYYVAYWAMWLLTVFL